MKKGDCISFKNSEGKFELGVVINKYTAKAKHIVNRGGHVECVLVLNEDNKLKEMPVIPQYEFRVISKGQVC